MEIVHIVRQFKPSVGGLEDAVGNLCKHLNLMPGIRARIITLDRVFTDKDAILPASELVDGIEVTRIPFKGSTRYPIAPWVLTHIKSADIVHVHAIDFFFDFLSATRLIHRKPLVASTHGGFFHTAFAARMKRIYFNTVTRFSCLGYKAICASSENDAANFRIISPSNVITIENGVNVEKWRDCGNKSASRNLLFIGRWSANKRVPMLIRLMGLLKQRNEGWKLIIAGLAADETVQSLTKACEENGVTDCVTIVSSPSESEITQLIARSSYIASASGYEGFGISIIEGLSAGLIPVITPLPPFRKLLDLLGFGVVIEPENLPATADALNDLHKELTLRTEHYRSQSIALSGRYAWQGVAQKFMDVYAKALK